MIELVSNQAVGIGWDLVKYLYHGGNTKLLGMYAFKMKSLVWRHLIVVTMMRYVFCENYCEEIVHQDIEDKDSEIKEGHNCMNLYGFSNPLGLHVGYCGVLWECGNQEKEDTKIIPWVGAREEIRSHHQGSFPLW